MERYISSLLFANHKTILVHIIASTKIRSGKIPYNRLLLKMLSESFYSFCIVLVVFLRCQQHAHFSSIGIMKHFWPLMVSRWICPTFFRFYTEEWRNHKFWLPGHHHPNHRPGWAGFFPADVSSFSTCSIPVPNFSLPFPLHKQQLWIN